MLKVAVAMLGARRHYAVPRLLHEAGLLDRFAETILELTGSRSKLVFRPLPADDPMQRKPDITLASERLRWEPRTRLEDGLKSTIAYFDQLLTSMP